jgi:hypothetical protein
MPFEQFELFQKGPPMGDIRIRLRGNLATGEKEIVVEYDSDDDLTTLEHERRHRQIIEQLLLQGVIDRGETESVVFQPRTQPQADAQALSEG